VIEEGDAGRYQVRAGGHVAPEIVKGSGASSFGKAVTVEGLQDFESDARRSGSGICQEVRERSCDSILIVQDFCAG
jgi:hypothetical protein